MAKQSPDALADIMLVYEPNPATSLTITRGDLHTLYIGNWLNDEVMNFYAQLLQKNKFNYENASKTVLDVDLIITIVHVGRNHWVCVVLERKSHTAVCYDPLLTNGCDCGVFALLVADCLSLGSSFADVHQVHTSLLRARILHRIMSMVLPV
ncbi:hypothetical protein GPECTOR_12g456 [Gonium pectorale]|uniref:Ubiquitin-like protease family profile domain-containing protein n=1 Tax=Gonium pectorale TaxID=33097 RepID=A0A150GNS5_GONPE|nr:hypothetical protein GPECTOR_12g456 [Gonium pectorale]|eukprot:KXZ51493.1 hypothetical protein GPECTOR_12g456 [Gonium pectorale]